jgi:hypothetical protein
MQIGMRSYSWNLGTISEIGGGAIGTVRHPSRISIASPDYAPKNAYVWALPIGTAIMGIVYEALKNQTFATDPFNPKTGGTVPGFGGRGQVPETAALPGYMKDVYSWFHDPGGTALAKVASAPRLLYQGLKGEDWQGHLIANPDDPILQRMLQYFQWVEQSLGPISIHTLLKGEKRGSNISTLESMLGIRPAPMYREDPEGTRTGVERIERHRWRREQRSKRRQESQYGEQGSISEGPTTVLTVPRRKLEGEE